MLARDKEIFGNVLAKEVPSLLVCNALLSLFVLPTIFRYKKSGHIKVAALQQLH
jgi:hypothetical protein